MSAQSILALVGIVLRAAGQPSSGEMKGPNHAFSRLPMIWGGVWAPGEIDKQGSVVQLSLVGARAVPRMSTYGITSPPLSLSIGQQKILDRKSLIKITGELLGN